MTGWLVKNHCSQQGPTVQHRELCSNGVWQPVWEEGLEENGYMYMDG